jgi:hypothetical protein
VAATGPAHGLALWCPLDRRDGRLALRQGDGAVPWDDVVAALLEGMPPPGLVFVAAPAAQPPAALGPLDPLAPPLLRAGVRAVVSVQGDLAADATILFARRFFREVSADGRITTAVRAARRELDALFPGGWDWAAPVLFTLTVQGARWFQPLSDTAWSVLSGLRGMGGPLPVTFAPERQPGEPGTSAGTTGGPS